MNSIEYLQKVLDRKLQATSTDFKRYLFEKIDWGFGNKIPLWMFGLLY